MTMNDEIDMTDTIQAASDQLNADDLTGGPITVRIARVIRGPDKKQPVKIFLEGWEGKPWIPSKGMRRTLVHVWGTKSSAYVGKTAVLYRDPSVKFGGIEVGGIRISHLSDIPPGLLDEDGALMMPIAETRGPRKPRKILPLRPERNPARVAQSQAQETSQRIQEKPKGEAPPPATLSETEIAILQRAAAAAAAEGTAAFRRFWIDPTVLPYREKHLRPDLAKYQAAAVAADEKPKTEPPKVDGSPWGLDDPQEDAPELDAEGDEADPEGDQPVVD